MSKIAPTKKQFQQKLHDFCACFFALAAVWPLAKRLRGRGPDRAGRPVGRPCIYCARASSSFRMNGSAGAAERPGAGRRLCTGMRSAHQAIPAKVVDFCARGIAPTKIQFQQKLHDFCACFFALAAVWPLAKRLRGRGPDRAGRPVGRPCIYCARASSASPHGSAGAAERPGAGRRLCTGVRSAHQAIPAKVARLLRSRNCANKKAIPAKVARLLRSRNCDKKKAIPAKVARLLRVFLRSRQFGFASRLRGGGRKAGRRSAPVHGHAISTPSNSSKSCTTFALAELRQEKSNSSKSCTTFACFFALAPVRLRLTPARARPKGRAPVGAFARACDQHTKQFQQKLHDFCASEIAPKNKFAG